MKYGLQEQAQEQEFYKRQGISLFGFKGESVPETGHKYLYIIQLKLISLIKGGIGQPLHVAIQKASGTDNQSGHLAFHFFCILHLSEMFLDSPSDKTSCFELLYS